MMSKHNNISKPSSEPVPLASDLSNPLVVVHHISDSGWKNHADLDLTTNNWPTWHKHVVMVLQLSGGLDCYLDGETGEPDPALEPHANENWAINDGAVHAFIKTRCSSMELSREKNGYRLTCKCLHFGVCRYR